MSITTGSKYIYTNRVNNIYRPTDIVEIDIDASNMFIDTKNTYLTMGVTMVSSQYKLCPSALAGCNGMFRTVEISSGTGKVLESIYHYGSLYAVRDYYESTVSLDNRKYLHEGKPNKAVIDSSSANQYVDPTIYDVVNGVAQPSQVQNKNVEVCLPLYLSGCLSPDRSDVFPCLATKGLQVRVELEDAQTSLNAIKAPLYQLNNGENFKTGEYGGYSDTTGYAVRTDLTSGEVNITLKSEKDVLTRLGISRILTDDVEKPAHLFLKGQKIYIGQENKYTIASVKTAVQDGVHLVTVTLTTGLLQDIEEDTNLYISVDNEDNNASYALSNVKMCVGVVQPTQEYINKCVQLIKAGQFKFDIFSFTDYGMNIASNSSQNTLKLNCRNTRALSILCISTDAQSNQITEDGLRPDKQEPASYNFSLYNNIIVPSKLVSLDKFNHENQNLYNALALREMEKSINACVGWNCNNLTGSSSCFFVGRELAKPGYSYNCMNELALNINYTSNSALLMHNFVCHLRLLDCRDDEVYVSY